MGVYKCVVWVSRTTKQRTHASSFVISLPCSCFFSSHSTFTLTATHTSQNTNRQGAAACSSPSSVFVQAKGPLVPAAASTIALLSAPRAAQAGSSGEAARRNYYYYAVVKPMPRLPRPAATPQRSFPGQFVLVCGGGPHTSPEAEAAGRGFGAVVPAAAQLLGLWHVRNAFSPSASVPPLPLPACLPIHARPFPPPCF